MADYIVQEEDGTSRIDQEDTADSIELETSPDESPSFPAVLFLAHRRRRA